MLMRRVGPVGLQKREDNYFLVVIWPPRHGFTTVAASMCPSIDKTKKKKKHSLLYSYEALGKRRNQHFKQCLSPALSKTKNHTWCHVIRYLTVKLLYQRWKYLRKGTQLPTWWDSLLILMTQRFRNIFKVTLGTVPCTEIKFYDSLNT